jgi:hypothetical protein
MERKGENKMKKLSSWFLAIGIAWWFIGSIFYWAIPGFDWRHVLILSPSAVFTLVGFVLSKLKK